MGDATYDDQGGKEILIRNIKSDGLTLLLNFIVMINEKIKSNIKISIYNLVFILEFDISIRYIFYLNIDIILR